MSQDHATRGFLIHLGVYVLVVSLLAALNLYRNPDNLWFIWVLLGWGIGVAAHGLAILLQRSGRREETLPTGESEASWCISSPISP
jgi:hypothetical protein